MDSHEEVLRRSRAIVSDCRGHVNRWASDKKTMRALLLSARERIFSSQETLHGASVDEVLPTSWFKPDR
jgi:hypothetical protein